MNKTNDKQQAIQYLTDLMQTIAAAYYKHGLFLPPEEGAGFGRSGRLVVHESMDNDAAVSIDLYDLFGDGLPKCTDLDFDDQTGQQGMPRRQHAYCITYCPEWEDHPVLLLCNEEGANEFDDSFDLALEDVPLKTIQSITAWIESLLPTSETQNTEPL